MDASKHPYGIKNVEYVMTRKGPLPLEKVVGDYDYEHYIDKQIRPMVETLLSLEDRSFDDIIEGNQMDLFV